MSFAKNWATKNLHNTAYLHHSQLTLKTILGISLQNYNRMGEMKEKKSEHGLMLSLIKVFVQ